MSKIFNGTITNNGTRADFYNAIKEKFVALDLEYNSEASTNYSVVFNIGNMKFVIEDLNNEETASIKLVIKYGANLDNLVEIGQKNYSSTNTAATVSATRNCKCYAVTAENDFFFTFVDWTVSIPSNAQSAFIKITKPDQTNEVVFASSFTSDAFTVSRADKTIATKFVSRLSQISSDTNIAVLQHPMFYDTSSRFLGIAENMTISSVGILNTKYVINGNEYLSVFQNNSNNNILIPFPEAIN